MSWVHIIVHDFSTLLAFSDTRSVSGIYWAGSGRALCHWLIVTWFIQTINYIYNLMKVIYPLIFFKKKKVIKFCFSTLSWRRRARLRIFKFEVMIKYNNLDYCYVNCPAATSTAVHITFAETSSVSYLEGIYLTPLEPTWSLNFKMVACHVIDYLWFFISFLLAVYGKAIPSERLNPIQKPPILILCVCAHKLFLKFDGNEPASVPMIMSN